MVDSGETARINLGKCSSPQKSSPNFKMKFRYDENRYLDQVLIVYRYDLIS